MMNTVSSNNLLSLHFNLSCAPLVEALCEPLFNSFGITHFGCLRILENGQVLRIANNQEWTQKYFEREFFNDETLYDMSDVSEEKGRLLLLSGKAQGAHQETLCKDFGIWNALAIYDKSNEYGDHWFFGASRDNQQIINFYINNLDVLQHFILYFKDKISHLFDTKDSSKLISTKICPLKKKYEKEENIQNFMNEIRYNKYHLEGQYSGTFLSKREAECLLYFSQGRTMKEIAARIHLSPRTIETYINNIKNKVGCHTKGELVSLVSKLKSPF